MWRLLCVFRHLSLANIGVAAYDLSYCSFQLDCCFQLFCPCRGFPPARSTCMAFGAPPFSRVGWGCFSLSLTSLANGGCRVHLRLFLFQCFWLEWSWCALCPACYWNVHSRLPRAKRFNTLFTVLQPVNWTIEVTTFVACFRCCEYGRTLVQSFP